MAARGYCRHAFRVAAATSIGTLVANDSLSDGAYGISAHAQPETDFLNRLNESPDSQPRKLPRDPSRSQSQKTIGSHTVAAAVDLSTERAHRDGPSDAPPNMVGNLRPPGLSTDKLMCHRRDVLWPTQAVVAPAAAVAGNATFR